MTKLDRDLGGGLAMDEVDDALPCLLVFGRIETRATGRDSSFRRHAGHFGENQPRAALRTLGIVHEVPFVWRTVLGFVLRHRRDAHAIGKLKPTHTKWHEHWRPR